MTVDDVDAVADADDENVTTGADANANADDDDDAGVVDVDNAFAKVESEFDDFIKTVGCFVHLFIFNIFDLQNILLNCSSFAVCSAYFFCVIC